MSAQALNPPIVFLIDDNAGDVRLITEAVLAVMPAADVRPVTDSTEAVPRLKESLAAVTVPNLILLDQPDASQAGTWMLSSPQSGFKALALEASYGRILFDLFAGTKVKD